MSLSVKRVPGQRYTWLARTFDRVNVTMSGIAVVAALVAGARAAQAGEVQSRGNEQTAGAPRLVRSVVYFLNLDSAQVLIELDRVGRYQSGSSPDGRTFYVDLLGATMAPSLAAQSIPTDDQFVRQIRVLQTSLTNVRVEIDLKTALVPMVEVGRPNRLFVRWSRTSPSIPLEPPRQAVVVPTLPVPGRLPIEEQTAPVLAPVAPAVSRSSSESARLRTHGPVKTLQAVRLRTPLTIDGRLDEEAWSLVTPLDDFRQRDPDEGKPASERTELRVAYDDDALYVGVRLFDTQPEEIVRRRSRRDGQENADSVALYLDPRHDHLTGFMFEVSAAGVQGDQIIFNDWETDTGWDGVWESSVSQDQEGWTAEIRIPFSQLRFSSASEQTWGINLSRSIPRKHETVWLELVPKQEHGLASRMAHLAGLDGIKPTLHLELLPYTVARAEFITPEPGDPFNDGSRAFGGAGLDLKWGLTRSLTLDATVNPDFGQVEVDPAVINLTQFETFFEEKRPFFLEGSKIFTNFGKGGSGSALLDQNLFYSRRIGLAPSGSASAEFVESPQATTILGAAKLTGKSAGGWSVGLLEALTSREYAQLANGAERSKTEVEPLTNYFVGRVMRDGNRAGFGLLATTTSRDTSSSDLRSRQVDQAVVAGIDGYTFLDRRRDWVMSGQMTGSWIGGTPSAILRQQQSSRRYYQRPDATHVYLDPTADSLNGWSGGAGIRRTARNFRVNGSVWATSPGFEANDLGFQSRADVIGTRAGFTWKKYTPDRFTRERELKVSKSFGWNFGHELQDDSWSVGTSATLRNYWELSGDLKLNRRAYNDRFTRSGPLVLSPARGEATVGIVSDQRKPFTVGMESSYAWNDVGAWDTGASAYVDFRPNSSLNISSGPYLSRSYSFAQYVDTITDPRATNTLGARYVYADLDQTQLSLISRVDLSLTPNVSLQVYLEPFFGVGRYWGFKELARPRTFDFLRYGSDVGTIAYDEAFQLYEVDPDGRGPSPSFEIGNENFNFKSLVAKAVFRWQWRPGSTLYVGWTQQRFDEAYAGDFSFGRDARALFGARGDDVFLVKVSYWLGR
jgi:hypothetical protein